MYAVGIRVGRLVACVILFIFEAKAQEASDDSLRQGKMLETVQVSDTWLHSYAVGDHTAEVDSLLLIGLQSMSLGKLLQKQEGIYLKEYGPGMLSSISLRGTAASQTSLLWNGLPVNFPSLGQADFSLVPNFFIDKAEVFYGGVSSLAGSGAIGGAVAITDELGLNLRSITLTQEAGSFGTTFSGLKASVSTEKAGVSVAGFYKKSDNDYTFQNLSKTGQPLESQSHGAYVGKGLKAAAFWRPRPKGAFDFSGWLTDYNREIIPPYTVPSSNDTQRDRSLRLSLGYTHRFHQFLKWESKAGNIYDYIKFNGLGSATTQFMWNNTMEWSPAQKVQLRVGSLVNRIFADVPEYGGGLAENRVDVYLMSNWFLTPRWVFNAQIREGAVAGNWNPLSPSVGSELRLLEKGAVSLDWRAQVSRSYRVPTLNDRYWRPGGNLALKPERGWNAEFGFDFVRKVQQHMLKASVTGFGHWIEDWILWLPQSGNYWSPVNVRNVFSRGLELSATHEWKSGCFQFSSQINYKLTVSQIQKGYSGDDGNVGNQLPYVPLLQGSWVSNLQAGLWTAGSSVAFYGSRYTLADNDIRLNPYALWDVEVGRLLKAGKSLFALAIKVDNILGTRYENLQYRPMPGRSYSVQLNYTLNRNRK